MFTFPVWDILASYTGDSKKFSFSGEIFDGYMEDITFQEPLEFSLQAIALDDGVEVLFQSLSTKVLYDGRLFPLEITEFARTWKKRVDPLVDADDVRPIDMRSMTIDLAPVIREEIIMACHSLSL